MLLELTNIDKSFGGLQVLSDISFHVKEGEIVGLIGPNGAGKTTIFNVITGIHRPNRGSIRFKEKDISGLSPFRICRKGISRTFQLVRIFPSMTVLENILVASIYGNEIQSRRTKDHALESLHALGLERIKDTLTAHLTLSDRRLVEIARAIAAKPRLTLLDEPLAGLNPTETRKIMDVILDIRKNMGISILWIEHKVDAVFNICDRIVVLNYGKKLADDVPRVIAQDRVVMEAYLGEPIA
jgi:branched-chain amino acid transport system ATP-binding protein